METTYTIGDLAREFDLTLRALRFYEDRRLLHPRRVKGARIYSEADRERVRQIVSMTRQKFTLGEIADALRAGGFTTEQLVNHAKHLTGLRADTDAALDEIEAEIARRRTE